MCFNISVFDDDELERSNERFFFSFDTTSTSFTRNLHFYDQTTIFISDNEGQLFVVELITCSKKYNPCL